jgi:NNP family nitrate/nitrite transporter-like MFS transporter
MLLCMRDDLRLANRVLWLSTTAFTLLFAVWLMLGVLGIVIRDELGLDAVQLGWLTASAVLTGSLLRLPFGILTDRRGGRAVMIGLLLFCAAACVVFARAHGFAALLAAALLFGISGNSFSVGVAWNAAWFPRERLGLALGVFGAGNVGASVTKLLGPMLIGLVPVAGFFGGVIPGGWRFVPMAYAGLLLMMAAAIWVLAPRVDRTPAENRSLAAMLWPLRVVRVWRFCLYYVTVFGSYVAFSLWLPGYYHDVYGVTLARAGLLTATFIFSTSLLRPVGGVLADRHGARTVIYTVFTGMALACAVLCWPRSPSQGPLPLGVFFACLELLGVSMGIASSCVYKYIVDYFPRDVGAVGGIVGTVGALGGFVMPIAFGYLQRATALPQSCFWVLASLLGAGFVWLHLTVLDLRRADGREGAAGTEVA